VRLCAVITEPTVELARLALDEAAREADLAELRLDYLTDFDFSSSDGLVSLLAARKIPVIITCRAVEEGGRRNVADATRLRLLVEGARRCADYCDIEAAHYRGAARFSPDPNRLIVSHHNFNETPASLDNVVAALRSVPAAIHKIVTHARTITDSIAIFNLLESSAREGRKTIAMAMGSAGLITRVLGPSRGSFLTYASLGRGRESATGQITCRELIESFRIRRITPRTEIFGVMGNPVSHSASPAIHNRALSAAGLDAVYLPLEVADPSEFLSRMVANAGEFSLPFRGLSVTIPHKAAVIPLLDEVDETALAIGAVNTIVVTRTNRLRGFNTDIAGAMRPLERKIVVEGTRCAVIGAGGAARAVVWGLVSRGAQVTVFARDAAKAKALGDELGVKIKPLSALESHDAQVIINTTPVGMHGHSERESPVSPAMLRGRTLAYDLVYNPLETQFLRDARLGGCATVGGMEMLIEQAAAQFELWTGKKAPLDVMRRGAVEWLGPRS
jgi:3-dehydroquinate dehydratase/shikimate dehydrogenase